VHWQRWKIHTPTHKCFTLCGIASKSDKSLDSSHKENYVSVRCVHDVQTERVKRTGYSPISCLFFFLYLECSYSGSYLGRNALSTSRPRPFQRSSLYHYVALQYRMRCALGILQITSLNLQIAAWLSFGGYTHRDLGDRCRLSYTNHAVIISHRFSVNTFPL